MRVLIVKIGALGDVVMALPMVDALRSKYPNVSISWVCGRSVASLVQATGSVDELIVVDDARLLGRERAKYLEAARVWLKLAGRKFDLVLIGHRDRRYRILVSGVRARQRRSLTRLAERQFPIPGRYYGHEHVRLSVEAEGPQVRPRSLPFVPTTLSAYLEEAITGAKRPLVALAPGGAKNVARDQPLKRWPLQSYVELATALISRDCGVLMVGSSSDDWVKEPFTKLNVIDLVGRTNILELLGVFVKCDAIVTHDSGPMHLAALARARLVALFGPTDPAAFAPRESNVKVLWGGADLTCRPCYDGLQYAKCQNNQCMKQISVAQVLAALQDAINAPI